MTQDTQSILKSMIDRHLLCGPHGNPNPCSECEAIEQREHEAEMLQEVEAREKEERQRRDHPELLLSSCGVGGRYLGASFDSFEGRVGLKELCREFLKNPSDLSLSGGSGRGKTHMVVAILRELVRDGLVLGPETGLMVSVPDLLLEIRESFKGNGDSEKAIVDRYSTIKYLVLDDLGAEKTSEWSITTLYTIIDRRHRNQLPTIVTTNLSLKEIENQLSARIASRLAAGKVVTFTGKDFRIRR